MKAPRYAALLAVFLLVFSACMPTTVDRQALRTVDDLAPMSLKQAYAITIDTINNAYIPFESQGWKVAEADLANGYIVASLTGEVDPDQASIFDFFTETYTVRLEIRLEALDDSHTIIRYASSSSRDAVVSLRNAIRGRTSSTNYLP